MQMGSPGVSVVDVKPSSDGVFRGNDITSEANKVYSVFASEPILASNYSHVGIWNPGGSGITLLLDFIGGNGSNTVIWHIRYLTAILASDDGVWTPFNGTGADGVCHGCSEQNVALQGTLLASIQKDSNSLIALTLTFPLVVLPNNGICVVPMGVGKRGDGYFIGREI